VTYVANIYKYHIAYKLVMEQEEERRRERESVKQSKQFPDEWPPLS